MGIDPVNSKGRFFQFNKNNQNNPKDSDFHDDSTDEEINSIESYVSSLSKNLSKIHQTLKSIGNEKALKGLDEISFDLVKKPESQDYLISSEFIKTINYFMENDEDIFINIFELSYNLKESGIDFYKWLKIFNSIDSYELRKVFVENSSKLLDDNLPLNEQKKIFNELLANTDKSQKTNDSLQVNPREAFATSNEENKSLQKL